jgi:hypothetical protein
VRALATHGDLGVQRAHAAHLGLERGRLEQDREPRVGEPRHLAQHAGEPAVLERAFLGVVEDAGQIEAQALGGEMLDQRQHHRVAGLHVAGAEADEPVAIAGCGDTVAGNRVEMARENDQGTGRDGARAISTSDPSAAFRRGRPR